jgi:hypothetical protein
VTTLAPCGTESAYARHVRRGERVDAACRAARRNASRDYRAAQRESRQQARLRTVVSEVRAHARPFVIPTCSRCGTRLCDAQGEPRWDVTGVGTVLLVCLGGCRAVGR